MYLYFSLTCGIYYQSGVFERKEHRMQFYGLSDIGRRRSVNQDSYCAEYIRENVLLLAVCDGMGGVNGGNVASNVALNSFKNSIIKSFELTSDFITDRKKVTDVLRIAVIKANEDVFEKAKSDPALKGMGTTLVAALVIGNVIYAANVGDSRLYIIDKKNISLLTHDHSFVQLLIDLGELTPKEAAASPQKNIITKAVGIDSFVEPDIFIHDPAQGPFYLLLCSDGLTNFTTEDKIHSVITSPGADSPKSICEKLIGIANKNGGGDNITAVLLKAGVTEDMSHNGK